MSQDIIKGAEVTWNTSGKHADQVQRAKSIYGDGPFTVGTVVHGVDFNPAYNEPYVNLLDSNGKFVKNGENAALFETYLFQRV